MMKKDKIDIKSFRKEHDLTQFDIALMVGVSSETVRRWEAGVVTPNEENMEKLKEVMNEYK